MNIPVFDLHCDTVLGLMGRDFSVTGDLRANQLHIDLERAGTLAGYAQCFAIFTTTAFPLPKGIKPEDIFWRAVSALQDSIDKNSDVIRQARSASDVLKNHQEGKMSAIFTVEGPAGIGFDPAKLEKLHQLGFRISSLGWNEQNPLTGSHKTGGGVTKRGREYVKECQRLGILVDVSHISDEGFWDIIDMTDGPVVATHSNSRAVCDVSRNITDDMFRAICATGGVAGINLYADFVGPYPTVDTLCDHVFHFLEMDPDGKHIALGGDLDGSDVIPEGFHGIEDYPKLSDRLLQRGLSKEMVYDIFWNNALEVMKRAVHNYQR